MGDHRPDMRHVLLGGGLIPTRWKVKVAVWLGLIIGGLMLLATNPLLFLLLLAVVGGISYFRRSSSGAKASLLLPLIGVVLMICLLAYNALLGLLAVAVFAAAMIFRRLRNEKQLHARRMSPNERVAIEVALSNGFTNSEERFQGVLTELASGQIPAPKERLAGRGASSVVFQFSRPDPHGQVEGRTFLESDGDHLSADELEGIVQANFGGEASVFPVSPASYTPFQAIEQWQLSQGADADENPDLID